ncbi:efflux RND transporter periplasmic adaptor subunit [Ferruginibacter albus]|uniref:efflux RND transporter periplasmic adaptor subunit n=1 Tax=Ferruginibacter albus TaxID=2875540 RepID=UPI001CC3897F|nr:HlyD family efflux transporter periplasmic adaptor subunit [Ferruginibacter albus]UAY51254.1 HlyD family efflux transporter periplasmic adaptor subunit [Ferruginibacter albus]
MQKLVTLYLLLMIACFNSCKPKDSVQEDASVESRTPVTITSISSAPMEDYVELNATSSFLQKWMVRANATGYLQLANVSLNKYVAKGQNLFSIKTKEAQSIGNSISILDSTFKFSGVNTIKAEESGFISQIDHQSGEYVQDGEQLAVITDTKSFAFLLDMPYELRPYLLNKKSLEINLPDGEKLTGIISGNMPTMDAASQTQKIILKINVSHPIPENLIAKVRVIKSSKNNTSSLPRAAVLTDETQSDFWVMKMIDSTTAVKVPVKKGIETTDKIEILSPVFSSTDKILLTGNYSLPDTAKVQIIQ